MGKQKKTTREGPAHYMTPPRPFRLAPIQESAHMLEETVRKVILRREEKPRLPQKGGGDAPHNILEEAVPVRVVLELGHLERIDHVQMLQGLVLALVPRILNHLEHSSLHRLELQAPARH